MAKDKKVEQITDMEVDFAQWFTDLEKGRCSNCIHSENVNLEIGV